MGEESTVPGSDTLIRRRWPRFAAVMPVGASLTSPRPGSSPNSGQSWLSGTAVAVAIAGAGIADGCAVGVETSAGAALPQEASRTQAASVTPRLVGRRTRIATF